MKKATPHASALGPHVCLARARAAADRLRISHAEQQRQLELLSAKEAATETELVSLSRKWNSSAVTGLAPRCPSWLYGPTKPSNSGSVPAPCGGVLMATQATAREPCGVATHEPLTDAVSAGGVIRTCWIKWLPLLAVLRTFEEMS